MPLLLFAAILLHLFYPHSVLQARNESVPLMNADIRGGGSRALTDCGGGRVETTEQCWSLKVRCERDVAEQALSLGYTAGSVATDCSPAPLPLFRDVPSLTLALSDVILLLRFLSPQL